VRPKTVAIGTEETVVNEGRWSLYQRQPRQFAMEHHQAISPTMKEVAATLSDPDDKDESLPEAQDVSAQEASFQFPFFDMNSSGVFSSPQPQKKGPSRKDEEGLPSAFDEAISPISKDRESASTGGLMDVSAEDPTAASLSPEKTQDVNDAVSDNSGNEDVQNGSSHEGKSASLRPQEELLDLEEVPSSQSSELDTVSTTTDVSTSKSKTMVSTHKKMSHSLFSLQSSKDLSNVRKQVGQTSSEFIERIRSAAHKRRLAMTKSRDSLVAKEKAQLLSIAADKEKLERNVARVEEFLSNEEKKTESGSAFKPFKARPLPETTGPKGMGGLVGVPKVEKKPTTTPFSPLLGNRRPQKPKIKALEKPKTPQFSPAKVTKSGPATMKAVDLPSEPSFKARPVPSFVGKKGHGGLAGVPKVPKRSVTVPETPGFVRRKASSSALQSSNASNHRVSEGSLGSNKRKSSISAASPVLLGLNLLDVTRDSAPASLNEENLTPRDSQTKAYIPHSTLRAKKRADFDRRRETNVHEWEAERQRQRERDIRRIRKELDQMRRDL